MKHTTVQEPVQPQESQPTDLEPQLVDEVFHVTATAADGTLAPSVRNAAGTMRHNAGNLLANIATLPKSPVQRPIGHDLAIEQLDRR